MMLLTELMVKYVVGDVTIDRDVKRGVFGVGGARIYLNMSHLLHLIDVRKYADDRRVLDTTLADIYEQLDVDRYRSERPLAYLRRARLVRAAGELVDRKVENLLALGHPRVPEQRLEPASQFPLRHRYLLPAVGVLWRNHTIYVEARRQGTSKLVAVSFPLSAVRGLTAGLGRPATGRS